MATAKTTAKMTMAEAAHRLLLKHGTPMHYREIMKRALKGRMVDTKGKTPEQSLRSLMATEFIKKASRSRFRPKGNGLYALTAFGKKTPPSTFGSNKSRTKTKRKPKARAKTTAKKRAKKR